MTIWRLLSLICITQLWLCPIAHGIERWKEKKNSASSFEVRHEYQRAADVYQEALKILPANEENAKAKIQSAIALNLIPLKQYDKAFKFGEDAAVIANALKLQNRLDPDVLLNLQFLLEASDALSEGFTGTFENRLTLLRKISRMRAQIRKALNHKEHDIAKERIAYARTFVALHDDKQAEKEMTQILGELSPRTNIYRTVQLAIAGLQEKRGLTSKLASDYLRTHKPETEAMRRVADGKFWAADYAGAQTLLNQALSKLSGTKHEKLQEEVRVHYQLANIKLDSADYKGAEQYYRRNIAITSKDPESVVELNAAKFQLANCLKKQNRLKEAAALQEPRTDRKKYLERYNFILTDKEKADLAKEREKRDGSK